MTRVDAFPSRRFVLLVHDWPTLHWDFMLEQGDHLETWRLESEPILNQWITAIQLPPHRLAYLDYEGPVSGGRGNVKRFDSGSYVIVCEFPRERWLELEGEFGVRRVRILQERGSVRVLLAATSSRKLSENR